MPLANYNTPYEYNRRPPSYLAGPDVQDYQGRYNDPQKKKNLSLLATSRDPSVAPVPTPAAPTGVTPSALQQQPKDPNWWAKLGPGGQSALMRSALVAGSAMLERTDPDARNPLTAISSGVLRGLEARDEIKEAQREEALTSRLAGISTDQPSAAYAEEIAKTYAGAGKTKESLGAFEAQSRLAPKVSEPPGLRTVGPGQGVYNPVTGETTVPVAATPKVPKPFVVDGRAYIYDETTGEAKPLTEREAEEFTLSPGAKRLRKTKEGKYETVAEGREKPKENIIEIDAGDKTILYNIKTGKEQASFERGARPSTGAKKAQFVRVPTGETDDFGASIEKNMLVVPDETREGGFRILEVPPDLEQYGPPTPEAAPVKTQISPELQAAFNTLRTNPKNADFTDEQLLEALRNR